MDYGKLAYLKAVDLEDRFSAQKRTASSVSVVEFDYLPSVCDIIEISGNGDIAVIVNSSHSATFFVDGLKVCEGNNVFFKLDGSGKISARSANGIDKLRLMAIGDTVISERAGFMYADYNGRKIAYLICENGNVKAYIANSDDFMPSMTFEGAYVQGDICAYRSDFIMALIDSFGTITLMSDGKSKAYSLGADKVAIYADDKKITVVYLKKGKMYYFEIDGIECAFSMQKIDFSGYVDDIRFVKKSGKLLFSADGKCYIRDMDMAMDVSSDKIYIGLQAEVV